LAFVDPVLFMGKLDKFLGDTPGYFRTGEVMSFPWDASGRAVWFALFVVENGKIMRYGFTASKSSKRNLIHALRVLIESQETDALLLGVWTGQYSTHLFVLDISKAIDHLSRLTE
jgi:hypothetical protein